jgi:hypothetical protein
MEKQMNQIPAHRRGVSPRDGGARAIGSPAAQVASRDSAAPEKPKRAAAPTSSSAKAEPDTSAPAAAVE